MSFGDFNRDGHLNGRDYIEYKISTGSAGGGGAPVNKPNGNMGCLTFVLIFLVLYVFLELVT